MGTTQSTSLNQDNNNKNTSAVFGDAGDAVDRWHQYQRTADGGDAATGATTDAAELDPTATASVIAVLKGLLGIVSTEDVAAVSGDMGVSALAVRRDTAAASAGTDGDYSTLSVDSVGQLRVTPEGRPDTLTNATTTALATSLVVKASAGTLYGFQGYSTTSQFLQLHNTTTLPADAAVPVVTIPIEAGKPFSVDFGAYGRDFSTGITVSTSTTGPTKTLGAADTWIDAQYE